MVISPTLGQFAWLSKTLPRMICFSSKTETVCSTTICSSTPLGSKTYEKIIIEVLKRPTSKLNLSVELLFESEEDEERADKVLERTDPCSW